MSSQKSESPQGFSRGYDQGYEDEDLQDLGKNGYADKQHYNGSGDEAEEEIDYEGIKLEKVIEIMMKDPNGPHPQWDLYIRILADFVYKNQKKGVHIALVTLFGGEHNPHENEAAIPKSGQSKEIELCPMPAHYDIVVDEWCKHAFTVLDFEYTTDKILDDAIATMAMDFLPQIVVGSCRDEWEEELVLCLPDGSDEGVMRDALRVNQSERDQGIEIAACLVGYIANAHKNFIISQSKIEVVADEDEEEQGLSDTLSPMTPFSLETAEHSETMYSPQAAKTPGSSKKKEKKNKQKKQKNKINKQKKN